MSRLWRSLLCLLLVGIYGQRLCADLFVLVGGSRVEGTWINRGEKQPEEYVVRTREGSEVILQPDRVARIVESTPEERRYESLLPKMPNTAEGNWKMAEWCRQRGLMRYRTPHLEAAIELNPDHADAREALGYTNRGGVWARPDDVMRDRGYVKHKGKMYLPQELELVKARETQQAAEKEWRVKLRLWHLWLGTKRDKQGREHFELLDDPASVPELARLLARERDLNKQKLLINTLARFGGPVVEGALVRVVLTSDNLSMQELARDHLLELGARWAYPQFIAALHPKDPRKLGRAAIVLGMLNNKEAIPPLIDVLVTHHTHTFVQGGPGSINTTFGSSPSGGGTGFSTGAQVHSEKRSLTHNNVLDALKNLTGVNFGYDQARWRAWFAETNTPPSLNLRRGP